MDCKVVRYLDDFILLGMLYRYHTPTSPYGNQWCYISYFNHPMAYAMRRGFTISTLNCNFDAYDPVDGYALDVTFDFLFYNYDSDTYESE